MAATKSIASGNPGAFVSNPVCQRIESERRRLQKADAVLTCLVFAVNHDAPGIDAGDVASVVSSLISDAVDALDMVQLTKV